MTTDNNQPLRPGQPGWVGHEWVKISQYRDGCIHCGAVAIEGSSKEQEHCFVRESKLRHESKPTETPE